MGKIIGLKPLYEAEPEEVSEAPAIVEEAVAAEPEEVSEEAPKKPRRTAKTK